MKSTLLMQLENAGLTQDQAKVYISCLELGEATMQELATKSGVPRTSIYNFIKSMIKKRLVASGKRGKRTVYSAVHPNILIEMQKGRLAELQALVPQMLAIHNAAKNKPRISYHEGIEGIKEVLFDIIKEHQEVNAWSDYDAMAKSFGEYYFDVFPLERAKKKIWCKTIVPDTPNARKYKQKDGRYYRESKLVKLPNLQTEINIYGNKVALNSFDPVNPFALLIEDKHIAATLRTIWQQQWEQL